MQASHQSILKSWVQNMHIKNDRAGNTENSLAHKKVWHQETKSKEFEI